MPSADFCAAIRSPRGSLSCKSGTTAQISPGKSDRLPRTLPDLQTWPLMDMDFATRCPLVRPRMPPIRFLSVRPRCCSALPSDAASRRPPSCFANPFCGRELLLAKLRPANIDASAGAKEEIAFIVAQIRERWPDVEIWLRADSGFCREELMAWCENNRVDY